LVLLALLAACGPEPAPRPEGPASGGLVVARPAEGGRDLFWIRLSDGAARPLFETPGRDESWPQWQPIGLLAFQVEADGGRGSEVVVWSPETGERPLADAPGREVGWAAWSPAAPRLAYAFRGGRPASGVAIADLDAGTRGLVASTGPRAYFLRPSWDPEGSRLVVQQRPARGAGSSLWLIAPGEPPRPLTADRGWFDLKARFTRDGRRIVFARRPSAGGPHDLMEIDASGGIPRAFASRQDSDDHSPAPSPVRDEVAFVSDRGGRPQIWLADLDGGSVRPLGEIPGSAWAPHWSPDGEFLAVTAGEGSADEAVPESLERARVVVLDRSGAIRFETTGLMPEWMPPWR
jgi:Tol biopolymer transport system component